MLVTPEKDKSNRRFSFLLVVFTAVAFSVVFAFLKLYPICLVSLPLAWIVYDRSRRKCKRRMAVVKRPFPPKWEQILVTNVAYYIALDESQRKRFQQLMLVFLDEIRITGIQTEVDDECKVLVGASAVIPIFGFPDWEYSRLGEILIYPRAFGSNFEREGDAERSTLGLVGTGSLGGVMILSKPALISGFKNPNDKRNVGIHEFAHLVDLGDGAIDGLPPGISADEVQPWIEWVHDELEDPSEDRHHINPYGYTNEVEFFAVLTEYFFEAPDVLQRKNPKMYEILSKMYRQDSKSLLSGVRLPRRMKIGRNSPCPCGSGKKYKKCCLG
jgi:MtfA peptidase